MKDLLIIFIVMLLLLILISTLGGSIYPKEHFDEKEYEQFWEGAGDVAPEEEALKPEPFYQEPEEEVRPEAFTEAPPSQRSPPAQQEEDVVEGFDGDQWATV